MRFVHVLEYEQSQSLAFTVKKKKKKKKKKAMSVFSYVSALVVARCVNFGTSGGDGSGASCVIVPVSSWSLCFVIEFYSSLSTVPPESGMS
jgi:hypothetical protein